MEMRDSRTRKVAYGTNTVILVISLLGIILVLNYFFNRHFVRLDLTEKKEYSISSSSKSILSGLDDIVTVKAYFSRELPPYMSNVTSQVRDMLEEFRAYSKGNFQFEFIDPSDDPDLEQKVRFEGIPQVQLNIIEKDKAELTNAYLGMAIHYADKKEAIPVVRNVQNLEYEFASILMKLTSKEIKTVGICSVPPLDAPADTDEFETLKEALQKQYTVIDVELTDEKDIPENVTTLILVSPENYTPVQKYKLDQFVMKGGKLVLLADTIKLKTGTLQAEDIKSNLGDLLNHYGLKVDPGLVVDVRSNDMAAFSMGYVSYQIPYPFFPRVAKENFSSDNPAVSGLETLVLPWTAPVSIKATESENAKPIVLARSSDAAFVQKSPYNLNPQQRFRPSQDQLDSVPLVVAISGKLKSFWAGKETPIKETGDDGSTTTPELIEESPETQIVLVGSSFFIKENFLRMSRTGRANIIFMSNVIDWLTLGDKLIAIRSRSVSNRPLNEVSEGAKTTIRFFNVIGISLLVVAFGLIRLMIKKRSQKMLETIYG